MKIKKRAILILSLILIIIALDQTAKIAANQWLANRPSISLVQDTIRLQYVMNDGGFLGFGSSLSKLMKFWLFSVGVTVILVLLFLYLLIARDLDLLTILSFSFLLGGGFSNLIDRFLYHGNVVDFLNIGIGGLRTGIFNPADMAITGGSIAIIVLGFTRREKKPAQITCTEENCPQDLHEDIKGAEWEGL